MRICMKSPAFQSWLLHLLASDSVHPSLSLFGIAMRTVISTPESCCEDSKKIPGPVVGHPELVSFGLGLEQVDRGGHQLCLPSAPLSHPHSATF